MQALQSLATEQHRLQGLLETAVATIPSTEAAAAAPSAAAEAAAVNVQQLRAELANVSASIRRMERERRRLGFFDWDPRKVGVTRSHVH
jgi:hypothetical protein